MPSGNIYEKMSRSLPVIVIIVLHANVVISNSTTILPIPADGLTCEFLQQSLCRNAGYNATATPNARGHETQDEASDEMAGFMPLWTGETVCSNAIVHLLCSFYFPFCDKQGDDDTTLKPCRNLCEAARTGCEDEIKKNTGLEWPTFLNCNEFPNFGEETLCFGPSDPSALTILSGELSTSAPATSPSQNPTTAHSQTFAPSLAVVITSLLLSPTVALSLM